MRSNNSTSTPLSVWFSFFSLILILAIVFVGFGEKIRSKIISKEINEIANNSVCNNQNLKIFAFGSSMFRTGIANRFEAPSYLSEENNFCIERTGYLNLTLSNLNRNKNVIKAIAASKSDIILIESPLIQYKTRSENRISEGRPRQTIRMLKQHYTSKERFSMDSYPKPFYDTKLSLNKDSIDILNVISSRQFRDVSTVKKFFSNLKELAPNATIIVCDIPRPFGIESKLLQRDQKLIEQHKQLYKSLGISYWEFNQPMEDELFFDIVHLNQVGQAVYMKWLIEQLEKETKH